MQATHYSQAVSTRVEKIMCRQSPRAMDLFSAGGSKSEQTTLNTTETGGVLAKLTTAEALSVCIYFHKDCPQDRKDLHKHIFKQFESSDWLNLKEYLAKPKYRARVDGMIYCAIDSFRANQLPTQANIAGYMGVSRATYTDRSKPWLAAFAQIDAHLRQVFMNAVGQIHIYGY